ncbi:MAG: GTPase Era [Alphaproteobacteria bacterium]|nr:GTPase Era [Alphaproteobacteria bacterium]MBP7758578.1 GTPase Era [Alphaproteobacteria bacterium]MBP7762010.1 GTPase Era [Alphaproteobacteria bacterium]MBP7904088.1 GTPase Era [Alphaproteobacteria bacterium]
MTQEPGTRCGFVSVIGLPNAGKSTLVNALVGAKVSIVSQKVQTTRTRILGILTEGTTQIALVDTPGLFAPKRALERAMVRTAVSGMEEGDLILHIVDVSRKRPLEDNAAIREMLKNKAPAVLVLNKIDIIAKHRLLDLTAQMNAAFPYKDTFMISAIKDSGVEDIRKYLAANLPEGVWLFPEDQMSDMPMRMLAAEITREKIFQQLHDELPYAIFVETEAWEEFDNKSIKISQAVFVERETQKAIVLGKGGSKIKEIGSAAREELKKILETDVHLKIHVSVLEKWTERPAYFTRMGLDSAG